MTLKKVTTPTSHDWYWDVSGKLNDTRINTKVCISLFGEGLDLALQDKLHLPYLPFYVENAVPTTRALMLARYVGLCHAPRFNVSAIRFETG